MTDRIPSFALALALVWGASAPAAAHLSLTSPPSRSGGDVLKEPPCGRTGSTRSANVTTYAPGETIEVVWDEYIDHPGHYRIAFDPDGDDDFADPACLSGCDTRTPEIETDTAGVMVLLDDIPDQSGGEYRVEVTLPDVECDNCTLQVIQVMYDKPPQTRPGNDIYYQCADLVLTSGAPPPSDAGVDPGPDSGPDPDPMTDGGCAVAPGRDRGAIGLGLLALLLWLAARRRARSRRPASSGGASRERSCPSKG